MNFFVDIVFLAQSEQLRLRAFLTVDFCEALLCKHVTHLTPSCSKVKNLTLQTRVIDTLIVKNFENAF